MNLEADRRSGERLAPRLLLTALLLWTALLRVWVALPNPTRTRFWDERFSVRNVARVVETGSLRPANGFYPTLSYLPQALLLGAAQAAHERWGLPTGVLADGPGLDARGYRLCRLLQAAFGVLSVWALYLLGRRLFGPGVGLLAAFLFAALPWHLRQSVIFKPDVLLLATGLLSLVASLRALARPSPRRFAVAGAAIGLCLASKFNAAPFALPLALGALWRGWREDRRILLWLGLAAAVALAVLFVIDPWLFVEPELHWRDFGNMLENYEFRSQHTGVPAWALPLHALQVLVGSTFHGPWLGALALLTLAATLVPRLRAGWPAERLLGWMLLVAFFVAYVAAYSLATDNASPHNWLPLTPVTSLAAAWGATAVARWAARRWPRPARNGGSIAAVLFVALASAPVHAWAYREAVPGTRELAEAELARALRPLPGRVVLTEVPLRTALPGPATQVATTGRSLAPPLIVRLPRLTARPEIEPSLADALVFPAARLADPAAAASYRRWTPGPGRRVVRIPAAPFRRRGPSLVLVLQPLRLVAARRVALRRATGPDPLAVEVVDLEPGQLVSVQVVGPAGVRAAVAHAAGDVPCLAGGSRRQSFLCTTARFHVEGALRLRLSGPRAGTSYHLMSWRMASRGAIG